MNLVAALTIPYRLNGREAFDAIIDTWEQTAPDLPPTSICNTQEPLATIRDRISMTLPVRQLRGRSGPPLGH